MMNGRGAAAIAAVVVSSSAVAGFGVAAAVGDPGEPGRQGEPGVQAPARLVSGPTYTRTDSVFVAPHASQTLDVYCDPGDHATGGGYLSQGAGDRHPVERTDRR